MNINDNINGFKVLNIRKSDELNGEVVEMKHQKSGARLLWLNRPDSNKTFSITFRTIPNDDTGIFHILEHSVLCGSKKYPVKEPFVELIKNSMNTFLNALTFPDKTMYPISSKNDKDFFNLMDVYLDAVFNPAIYTKPEIFYQEGWHYEFDENDNVSYKGVVFNEMKGVYADADSVKENKVQQLLFPNNCYGYESGGHPTKIPTLTYEKFIDGHKTFYHPSNSYIILDGSMDIAKVCAHINDNYLKYYDTISPCPLPKLQTPVKTEMEEIYFEQSKDMPLENQSSLTKAYVLGTFEDKEKIYACHILGDILCENNQSFLTKALLEKGYCEDVEFRVLDGIFQPFVMLDIKNIDENKSNEINDFINSLLKQQIAKGIDQEELEAAISNLEFQVKEKDFGYPRGLYYAMSALETWLYDGDPITNIVTGSVFEDLREKAQNGYMEKLIDELLLSNDHCCTVLAKPSYDVGDNDRVNEQKRIDNVKASWSDNDIKEYKEKQEKLLEWQNSVDSPENLAKIPMITLDDIDIEPELIPTVVEDNVIKHSIQTDGIVYFNLYFDITGVKEENLSKLAFLCSLLGELDTKNYSAKELKTQLLTKCGSYTFSIAPMAKYNDISSGKIKLVVSFSALNRYASDAISLIKEIITSTKFDNKNAITDIIKQQRQSKYQSIVMAGSVIAMKRSCASISYDGVVSELTNGFAYYQWLKSQESNPTVIDELDFLKSSVFLKNNLFVGVTNDDANLFDNDIASFISSLDDGDYTSELIIKTWEKSNDAIVIPGDIAYSGFSGNFDGLYNGSSMLLSHIISLDYFWNEVRVKGGAYGTGLRVAPNGTILSYSYRDPNPKNSIEVVKNTKDYLNEFVNSKKNLVGFIIGCMSGVSQLLTPRQIGSGGETNYFRGITHDSRRTLRQQIVSSTMDDLEQLIPKIDFAFSQGNYCVIGSQKQIDSLTPDNKYSL